jgi:hypothetical protein
MIRSYYAGPGANNLRAWVVEGSIDRVEWIQLDRRDDNSELNGRHIARLFEISHPGEYQFIRLRQTGKNHANTDSLIISGFEVFGTFLEPLK